MRILVCGDRHWSDDKLVRYYLNMYKPEIVISGMAPGADTHAADWANNQPECKLMEFQALWDQYGRAAGQQMLDEGKPDLVLAFHDDLPASKGTKDMVSRAEKAGVPTRVIGHASPLVPLA